jgi:hypothetical protein
MSVEPKTREAAALLHRDKSFAFLEDLWYHDPFEFAP